DSSPAIGSDGTVYFGSWDNKFYAFAADGVKKWQFATGAPVDSSPAIGGDGTIYFGSHDRKFYAITPGGSNKWTFETGGPIGASPAIGPGGVIYFSSFDGKLYALNPDGSKKWQLATGGIHECSPVLDSEGNIYIGVNNHVVAISPEGVKKWESTNGNIEFSGAVGADGTIYVGNMDGYLLGLNRDGTIKSLLSLRGPTTAAPTLGRDGTFYAGVGLNFFAIKVKEGPPLAESVWPAFRANPRQTGRVPASNRPG
ncbi:MAG TPA: PQQ-binding-like beta-propeller repeat protein, partial [Verrucomicrobiae bacterium]|nr:PQQ-binding-like beta-propeller repeat protein [Verrucomicrobiae bacterium]